MLDSIKRRDFLAATGAAGITLAASGSARAQDNAGAANRLLVGILGTGGRGKDHTRSYLNQSGVEVAAVCDVDQRRAEEAAAIVQKATNRAPRIVTDFRRILDDRDINVVSIASCNHWHAPMAILACAAGKHVYVEKPCSHNPREGELMVQAARKHKKHVQMGNQRRSWPAVIAAIEELRKGVIGRIYHAQAWYTNNRPTIGIGKQTDPPKGLDFDLWQGPAPRRPFRTNILHYNWHWFWHWGNGELGNNGVHSLDLCRWGMGVDYPVRVTSLGGRYRYQDDQETPDTHQVNFEFEGRRMITWEGFSCNRLIAGRTDHVRFHGETGCLALNDNAYTIYDVIGKEVRRVPVQSGDAGHFQNLLDAIRTGARLNSEIEEGHKSTLMCHLGNIAYRNNKVVTCDARNGHILNDKPAEAMWSREYEKGWEPRV